MKTAVAAAALLVPCALLVGFLTTRTHDAWTCQIRFVHGKSPAVRIDLPSPSEPAAFRGALRRGLEDAMTPAPPSGVGVAAILTQERRSRRWSLRWPPLRTEQQQDQGDLVGLWLHGDGRCEVFQEGWTTKRERSLTRAEAIDEAVRRLVPRPDRD